MKRYLTVLITVLASLSAAAQAKGVKIAYIDMEYILSKAPDFAEAKNQLEQRAAKWKQEMDVKRNDISKLKESLQAEKALLTKELIDEREEEIAFLEKDLSDYQEKKFGPKGELITQKTVLVKPIQDQVFTIVQDLAEARKYDFVFDKSSDLTMIFSAKKHDISDLIVKRMSRSAKQQKMTSKEAKKLEEQEKLDEENSDPDKIDKQKALDDKKAARQKLIDDRKAAAEAKRQAAVEKREQLLKDREAAREAKKNGTATPAKPQEDAGSDVTGDDDAPAPSTNKTAAPQSDTPEAGTNTDAADKTAAAKAARDAAAAEAKRIRQEKLDERNKAIEQRKKEAQEKRDAAKKAREEKQNGTATPAAADPTTGDDDPPATGGN
ncbi:OmpH family outer membrane protein [Flavobacterium sp. RHBU_24]|uniref:OmpH family outer membrane protein n=1 Tax=Flavobacterium sp. RHBU_24 TaxID=3391185 RepID=UPI003984670A